MLERDLVDFAVRPLRRREYERLVDMGVFEGEKIELLDGVLVEMSPEGPAHSEVINRIAERFSRVLGNRARIRVQHPLSATGTSVPEPDIAIVERRDYSLAHPGPRDAFLLVEVSDSSLKRDRRLKLPVYAKAGVREVWIVNLQDRCIEVYRDPKGRAFRTSFAVLEGRSVRPLRFPRIAVSVRALLAHGRKRQGVRGTRTTNGSS